MPFYDYQCKGCECVFETRHSMHAEGDDLLEATRCPDCQGADTEKMLVCTPPTVFVRGHDWAEFKKKNKSAMRRDMALHQLRQDDPYSHMRQPGDAEELEDKLKSGATKPKTTKYFTGASKRS